MKKVLTDEELIRKHLPLNPTDCFEELYSRYVTKVYHRCLSLTRDSEQAQDFTHDIFLKVFAKLESFQGRSSFSTWLYSISHNYCMDQLRWSKRSATEAMEANDGHDLADANENSAIEEALGLLKEVVDQLAPDEKILLRLKYEEELSVGQIAMQYGISESAVKMRLKRTRDKIYNRYPRY
ncbi:RNA polymerase sigma factor [Spirosoma knui]